MRNTECSAEPSRLLVIGGLSLEKPHKCCPAGSASRHKYHKILGWFCFPPYCNIPSRLLLKKDKSVLLLKPKVLHIAPKCISAVFTYAETLIQRCRDFDLLLSESQDQRNNLSEGFSDQV